MPHNDDTIDFLETTELLRGYPSDSPPARPAGGLNQHLTHLCGHSWLYQKTHEALWRQSVAHNPLPLTSFQPRIGKT